MLAVAMLVCLGALSSTVLATIRVTFALARDGLTFRFMARMSRAQAPVPALIVVGVVSVVLVWNRDFEQVLGIYFFAAAVLFGLTYASLIVFRLREPAMPPDIFRCPAGPLQAAILILCQSGLAIYIAWNSPHDAAYSTLMLVGLGLLYVLWKGISTAGRG
jgi:amino acid transporter